MIPFKPKKLSEQAIVITGASSGIGLATAKMAAARGARVVLSSRNSEDLDDIVRHIREAGGKALAVATDVTNYTEMEQLREEAEREYGIIDTWINNAGTSIFGKLLDVPLPEEKKLFEVNFWGVRNGCRIGVDAMRANGGVLINLGGEVSVAAIPLQGMYSATKQAVKAYTDALRLELARDQIPIAVSLIRPAAIDTPFPEHAVNRLKEGAPSLPNPTYHPDVAAEAILRCAEKPQRDVYVGASSRFFALLSAIFPEMTDSMMEKTLFEEQTKGDLLAHHEVFEGLHHAPVREGRVHGNPKGRVGGTSAYTRLSHSSLVGIAAGIGLGAGALLLARWASQESPRARSSLH